MALGIGLEHSGHAGEVPAPGLPEEREGFRVDPQMHGRQARRLAVHDPRRLPEPLAQLDLRGIGRGWHSLSRRPHRVDLVE